MKSRWIMHQGKRIMVADYTSFAIDLPALQAEINAVDDLICQEPDDSVLLVVDVNQTTATVEVVEIFKQSSARTTRHLKKVAVVGVSGLRRMLLDVVSRFSGQEMTVFDNLEAAKNWLVEE
jgi:hypothetical protein